MNSLNIWIIGLMVMLTMLIVSGGWWDIIDIVNDRHVEFETFCYDEENVGMWVFASYAVRMTDDEFVEHCGARAHDEQ